MTELYPQLPNFASQVDSALVSSTDSKTNGYPLKATTDNATSGSQSSTPIIIECEHSKEKPGLVNPLCACGKKDGDLWCYQMLGVWCCMWCVGPCMSIRLYRKLKVLGKIKSFFNFYFTGKIPWLIWVCTIWYGFDGYFVNEDAYKDCMKDEVFVREFELSLDDSEPIANGEDFCNGLRYTSHYLHAISTLSAFLFITLYKSKNIIDKIRKLKKERRLMNSLDACFLAPCLLLQVRRELNLIEDEVKQEDDLNELNEELDRREFIV